MRISIFGLGYVWRRLYKKYHPYYKKGHVAYFIKKRRVQFANRLVRGAFSKDASSEKRILEIGCANGKDFIQFFKSYKNMKLYGIDIKNCNIEQDNFTFIQADVEHIPFTNKYFDITVSFGLLEHIQPIEKLCSVISEIDRVSKSYCHSVPSISSFFEPHIVSFLWQLRDKNKKVQHPQLNYFCDEVWTKFTGFSECETRRFWYLPFFMQSLFIYKR